MDDHLINIFSSRTKKRLSNKKLTPAAVLVPLFHNGKECRLLLTRRSNKVLHHKGQISFPGGKVSEADGSLLDTALRESWEEVGLQAKDVKVIGELDDTPTTTTGFIISPYVALVPYPYQFTRNPFEIDELLDIPLSAFMDDSHCIQKVTRNKDGDVTRCSYKYNGLIIWGATARIIRQLIDTLNSTSGAQEQ